MRNALASASFAANDMSEVIGLIYDAAVEPALWPQALETCREFVGGASAAVFAKNITGNRCQLYYADGRLDAERARDYFQHMAPIDPSNTVQVFAEVEQAVITSRKIDPEDFVQTRFAREWALPQGLVDMVVAPIERQGSWAALFGVFRHERDGLGDEDARQRVTMLAPHIRRAFAIGDIVGKAHRELDDFRSTIDGLAAAVFLVDIEGRLVHVNQNGAALLGTSRAITSSHEGVLRLNRTSIRHLLPGENAPEPHSQFFQTTAGARLVIHVLPLTGGTRPFAGLGGEAVAALFVQPAHFDPPSIPESLARAYNLTPAELRVALATLRQERVADVAETLGLAEATVKTHLSRIFAKTDTRRQADIVKLVAAFASPLAAR
jgi:DNA-binding CsgD family transcriptional regulator/PAS domain-containing protein